MKTNPTIKRLCALMLAGGIAVLSASAAGTTTNTDKAAPNTTAGDTTAAPATNNDQAKPMTDKPVMKHHRRHHRSEAGASWDGKCPRHAWGHHAWLGAIVENSHAPEGRFHHFASDVRLTRVFRGSPACRSGLRSGDVIWKFDGMRLRSTAQLRGELREVTPGDTVPVEIFRDGKREDLKVTLGGWRMMLADRRTPM